MRLIPLVRYHLARTFKVMKRQGALPAALFDLAVVLFCILYASLAGSVDAVYVLFIFLAYFMWEISDAYKDDARDEMKATVMALTDEAVLLKAERDQLKDEVEIMKALTGSSKENPIKSNRLVSDKTFAVRLRDFMEGTRTCDAFGEEEKEYFLYVSERLLKWQTKTVRKGSEEMKYLQRLGLMPQPDNSGTEGCAAEEKPKRKPSPRKKTKTKETNENKDQN